jgi:hypothetical protein
MMPSLFANTSVTKIERAGKPTMSSLFANTSVTKIDSGWWGDSNRAAFVALCGETRLKSGELIDLRRLVRRNAGWARDPALIGPIAQARSERSRSSA